MDGSVFLHFLNTDPIAGATSVLITLLSIAGIVAYFLFTEIKERKKKQ